MRKQNLEAPLLDPSPASFNRRKKWNFALCFLFALTAISFIGLRHHGHVGIWLIGDVGRYNGKLQQNADVVESEQAVVAADDGRCSEIGISMLKIGGHAVDAAVATALCLGVVNPMASGLGGGGFMVVRSSSTSEVQAIDMRETAPLAASQNMYDNNGNSKLEGALSMGVPGELAGLYAAWSKHGRLPWKTLFQPAIKLARDGFVVAPYLAHHIAQKAKVILKDPGLRQVIAPEGKLLRAGEICHNVELSHSLELIAEQGPEAFYNGEVGEKLVEDVKRAGGILTMDDLRNYKVETPEAVTVNAMGYTIVGMPPPSSGTLGISLILKILESYNAAEGYLGLHRLIEAMKHMFAVRMDLGDPDFVNISKTVSDMLSPSFAKEIQRKIFDNTTFPPEYYMPRWSQLRDHGTSHFCIVDSDRNAVSVTTTVNYAFGAGVLSPSTGIVINDEMGDFSTPSEISPDELPPSPANFIQPKKRPLSSMAPIIVLKDNQLAGVIGGSGGMKIIPAVVQVFINHFILGMDPLAAVQSPRVYHELIPNVVLYENWTCIDGDHIELSDEKKHFLEERGHQLEAHNGGAICQLVVQNLPNSHLKLGRRSGKEYKNGVFRGMLVAVSDPRKDGRPAAI
ncbi:PREDICTED: gamma-glutamyltranspeptidase 3 [Nicotiana attenuata]|uniref:Glutathione hydrolase n=1 Tax=Nicotiana attenuata TaxID=49451 RepID=A0A1J6JYR8_NICAT|nr:PREDICTED: gamma-glutamyltranspeptidase 3 [Nicotiana attenuata]OIT21604.1 gamma-glutamyltranspeptidase 3 [Nicotiana attenuata]